MTIKDLVMPINYFNLNDASFAINSAIFSLAGLILVVSIIYEYLNERDILEPLKRFIVAIILITIALPVQNFVVEKSFAAGDVLMNSLSDPDKLEMINDPSAFMDKLSEMFRSLQRSDEVRSAMGGMLQRMARAQGHAINQGYSYRYGSKRGQRQWLRSALEWLQRHNIYLWRGGIKPNTCLLSSPINLAIPGLSTQQQRTLLGKGIIHIGESIWEGV